MVLVRYDMIWYCFCSSKGLPFDCLYRSTMFLWIVFYALYDALAANSYAVGFAVSFETFQYVRMGLFWDKPLSRQKPMRTFSGQSIFGAKAHANVFGTKHIRGKSSCERIRDKAYSGKSSSERIRDKAYSGQTFSGLKKHFRGESSCERTETYFFNGTLSGQELIMRTYWGRVLFQRTANPTA